MDPMTFREWIQDCIKTAREKGMSDDEICYALGLESIHLQGQRLVRLSERIDPDSTRMALVGGNGA